MLDAMSRLVATAATIRPRQPAAAARAWRWWRGNSAEAARLQRW